jgi:small-conductance mechanosensitive channel
MGHEDKVVKWFSAVDWINERFTATHAHDIEAKKRAATVSNVLRKLSSGIIGILATLAIFNTLGISILPFLATAGVAGIAIAFGAQSLVKDFFRGFFLLAGNQIRQGDVVEIAGKSGLVEDMTLRYVQLRDYEGNVHYVPNGEIAVVTSASRSFAYAVVDIIIAVDQDVQPVIELMRDIGAQLRANAVFGPKILEDLDIAGIESWNAAGITLRARFKVRALEQSNVKREYLLRLKQAFDHHDIRQPQQTFTMIHRDPPVPKTPEGPPK